MRENKYINILFIFILAFSFSISAHGKRAKKKKKQGITISIKKAMKRSKKDQKKIRDRMNREADARIDSWDVRQAGVIEIKHTGTPSIEPVELGKPDYSMEELGEDHSGLNGLTNSIEDEPIHIDFDEELRDVSSMKD